MRALAAAWPGQLEEGRTVTLDRLAVGERARVRTVGGDWSAKRRLLEMGLCRDVLVEMVRRAPLGDPIAFRVRGYLLSLRAEQARLVVAVLEGA